MKTFIAILVILGSSINNIQEANCAPASQIPPLISFNDGKIGVNFLGFHAAAGLGGLLNGGGLGGLHAEAGTPFGQRAVAGLGGAVGQDGQAAGRLYAGATAGGNVRAAAGLGGALTGGEESQASGGLFSAASAGGKNAGASLAGRSGAEKDTVSYVAVEKAHTRPRKVYDENRTTTNEKITNGNPADNEKADEEPANSDKNVRVQIRGHPVKFNKFFNYVQNTDEVPSASHLSSRSSPVQKEPPKVESEEEDVKKDVESPPVVEITKAVQKPHSIRKYYRYETVPSSNSGNAQGMLDAFFGQTQNVDKPSSETVVHTTVNKNPNRSNTFFTDIFNIPISTLNAVSKFLSNSVPSHGGTLNVRKTVSLD